MPLRAVLLDIGDTLWAFPGDDRSVAIPHVDRVRRLFSDDSLAPDSEALFSALVARCALEREESRRRRPAGTQTATWVLAKEAFAELGFQPPEEELRAFADVVFDYEVKLAEAQPAEPELAEALRALRERGLALAAVSNTFVTTHTLLRLLDARGLGEFFREVVSSADIGYRKPHAGCFLPALSATGAGPQEALMVGDRLDTDIEGAVALGMTAVLTHQYRKEDPGSWTVRPHHVIPHLRDLAPLVDLLGGRG